MLDSSMVADLVASEAARKDRRARPLCPWCNTREAGSWTPEGKPSHGICKPCHSEQMALINELRQAKEVA